MSRELKPLSAETELVQSEFAVWQFEQSSPEA
jgi:hypothetical protein